MQSRRVFLRNTTDPAASVSCERCEIQDFPKRRRRCTLSGLWEAVARVLKCVNQRNVRMTSLPQAMAQCDTAGRDRPRQSVTALSVPCGLNECPGVMARMTSKESGKETAAESRLMSPSPPSCESLQGSALHPKGDGHPLYPFLTGVQRTTVLWWGSGQSPDLCS